MIHCMGNFWTMLHHKGTVNTIMINTTMTIFSFLNFASFGQKPSAPATIYLGPTSGFMNNSCPLKMGLSSMGTIRELKKRNQFHNGRVGDLKKGALFWQRPLSCMTPPGVILVCPSCSGLG